MNKEKIVYIPVSVLDELPDNLYAKTYFVTLSDDTETASIYSQGKWHLYDALNGWDIIEHWRSVTYWLNPVPLSLLVSDEVKELEAMELYYMKGNVEEYIIQHQLSAAQDILNYVTIRGVVADKNKYKAAVKRYRKLMRYKN